MAKRASQEARIVSWFETAPVPVVEVVFGIVQAVVKRRRIEAAPTTQPVAEVTVRKPRKKQGTSQPVLKAPAFDIAVHKE